MKPEDKILVCCVRQDYTEKDRLAVETLIRENVISWNLLFTTAVQHGVAPLVFTNLLNDVTINSIMPPEVSLRMQQYRIRRIIEMEKLLRRLEKALDLVAGEGLEVMIVKGGALVLSVYEQPWYTVPKDIDLIIKCKQDALPPEKILYFMMELHQSGIEFDFYEHHDVNMNGTIPVDFDRIWKDARPLTFRNRPIYSMSPEDLLIAICVNNCRKRFFNLKSLFDIREYIYKTAGLDWQKFAAKAKAYDCGNIVFTAFTVVNKTLGCELPQAVMRDLGVHPLRMRIIRWAVEEMIGRLSLYRDLKEEPHFLDRSLNWPVLLAYLTYRPYQVIHKIKQFYEMISRHIFSERLA